MAGLERATPKTVLGAVVALVLVPATGQAWTAFNLMEVNPVGKSVFEVVGRAGSGPSQYWCGAGDYARTVLGVKPTQRIYIWKAIGPSQTRPGYKAVQFALSPPPGKEDYQPGYSLSVKAEGDNMDAAMARRYCGSGFPL